MKKIIRGIYRRKRDGASLTYTVSIHPDYKAFSGKVFDLAGVMVGCSLTFPSSFSLTVEAQSKKWIEDYIEHELGRHKPMSEAQVDSNTEGLPETQAETHAETQHLKAIGDGAPLPANETDRLQALRELLILDTPPEERFDRIAKFARDEFDVPIAAISLVDADRQWFKASVGLDVTETPRNVAFCSHTILEPEHLVVEDAKVDVRFASNPLVTGPLNVRFYAGVPLSLSNGHAVGSICILDSEPRSMDKIDLAILEALKNLVVEELERRKGDA